MAGLLAELAQGINALIQGQEKAELRMQKVEAKVLEAVMCLQNELAMVKQENAEVKQTLMTMASCIEKVEQHTIATPTPSDDMDMTDLKHERLQKLAELPPVSLRERHLVMILGVRRLFDLLSKGSQVPQSVMRLTWQFIREQHDLVVISGREDKEYDIFTLSLQTGQGTRKSTTCLAEHLPDFEDGHLPDLSPYSSIPPATDPYQDCRDLIDPRRSCVQRPFPILENVSDSGNTLYTINAEGSTDFMWQKARHDMPFSLVRRPANIVVEGVGDSVAFSARFTAISQTGWCALLALRGDERALVAHIFHTGSAVEWKKPFQIDPRGLDLHAFEEYLAESRRLDVRDDLIYEGLAPVLRIMSCTFVLAHEDRLICAFVFDDMEPSCNSDLSNVFCTTLIVYNYDVDGFQSGFRVSSAQIIREECCDLDARGNILAVAWCHGSIQLYNLDDGVWPYLTIDPTDTICQVSLATEVVTTLSHTSCTDKTWRVAVWPVHASSVGVAASLLHIDVSSSRRPYMYLVSDSVLHHG